MERLVYSPKAYVYIQTDEGVYNLSDLVVSGNVHRKINQVSTAEVTFQNPNRVFTQPGNPTFRPMDKIMIFLQRLPGMPVQSFTGYLDTTPYYQMYPGTCTVSASCTLKRLQHTHFDPGLPFMMSFMARYGWIPDGQGGIQSVNQSSSDGNTFFSFGDSLAVGVKDKLGDNKSDATVGITSSVGLDKLRKTASKMPDKVVIQLGTNDFDAQLFRRNVREIMKLLGDRKVFWMNTYRGAPYASSDPINRVLESEADSRDNLVVLDWHSEVVNGRVKLVDGLHPDAKGYEKRAKMIREAVGNANVFTTKSGDKLLTADEAQSASMADLLFASLKHIVGWDENLIYIEKLPPSLVDQIYKIYAALHDQAEESEESFNQFLKNWIGAGSAGTGGTGGGAATGEVKGVEKIVPIIKGIAERNGIPPEVAIAACIIESGLGTNMQGAVGATYEYIGWYQQNIKGTPYANAGLNDRPTREDAMDLGKSCDLWCRAAARRADQHPSLKNNHYEWFMVTQGMMAGPGGGVIGPNSGVAPKWDSAEQQAKGLLAKYGNNEVDPVEPENDTSSEQKSGSVDKNREPSGDAEKLAPVIKNYGTLAPSGGQAYGAPRSYGGHAGIDLNAAHGTNLFAACKSKVVYAGEWGSEGKIVTIQSLVKIPGYPSHMLIGYGHMSSISSSIQVGDTVEAGTFLGKSGAGSNGQPHLHLWVNDSNAPVAGNGKSDGSLDPTPFVKASLAGTAVTDDPTALDSTETGDSTGFSDALAAAKAAGVFTSLNFPQAIDQTESILLTGSDARGRSLMNDQPILPFVEQLAKGSMRSFQSLPNGDFYAWHPDYFGAFGTAPYWEIDDIEILEGNIQISDDNLITHVFVTGATLPTQQIDITRKISTHGVVNILNAGSVEFLSLDPDQEKIQEPDKKERKGKKHDEEKDPELKPFLGDTQQALEFLQRYGARPYVEDAPFIRSHLFETFAAYQTFMLAWSRQFLTTFNFTFMPELFPGGIVKFRHHGIQMYIDEVHHSWDYQNGFTTQANLSAPAATDGKYNPISSGMVRARKKET